MLNYSNAQIEVIVKNCNYRKINNYFNTFYKKKPIKYYKSNIKHHFSKQKHKIKVARIIKFSNLYIRPLDKNKYISVIVKYLFSMYFCYTTHHFNLMTLARSWIYNVCQPIVPTPFSKDWNSPCRRPVHSCLWSLFCILLITCPLCFSESASLMEDMKCDSTASLLTQWRRSSSGKS